MDEFINDILAILRPLWLILIFQIAFACAIWFLPQGKDVMLIIMEDSIAQAWTPLLCFALALLFLSVVSEFGSRFILYLSDTSSYNLDPARVDKRKKIINVFSNTVLFLPTASTIVGFILVTVSDRNLMTWHSFKIFVPFLFVLGILWLFYLGPLKIHVGLLSAQKLRLSPEVQPLITKLSGILQEQHIPLSTLPSGYSPLCFEQIAGSFVIRKPTISNFKPLFIRFYILLAIAILTIAIFLLPFPNWFYISVGSLAILCAAFASWLSIYIALEMLDKAQPFLFKFNFKLLALMIICFSSCVDNDHIIWTEAIRIQLPERPILTTHFDRWRQELQKQNNAKDSVVIFIAAEGGALRTGYFTAMMLAKLDSLYPNVLKKTYAYSSVSGGTLGVNFFNALKISNAKYSVGATRKFFEQDFLAPVTAKLAFGDVANYFLPTRIKHLDREYALERGWEEGFNKAVTSDSQPKLKEGRLFEMPFDSVYLADDTVHPAMFINSTEVETGQRSIYSNVRIDAETFPTAKDIYAGTKTQFRYSSVIGLSTRFPLVSPAGAVENCGLFHYVDGGYYENRGATTLLEAIKKIKKTDHSVKPYVIIFAFGDYEDKSGGKRFADELTSILSGIYNVRSGHTDHATELLKREVGSENFIQISPENNVPMNWVFSAKIVNSIDEHCLALIKKHRTFFEKLNH